MQVWNQVKVKEANEVSAQSEAHAGKAGTVQKIDGDLITVKLDLEDSPVEFDRKELIYLG